MSNAMAAAHASTKPVVDSLFGDLWPDPLTAGRPRLVGAAVGVGLLAAVVVPWRQAGLGAFVTLAAVIGVVACVETGRRSLHQLGYGMLCLALLSTVLLRDAEWIVALCFMAAFAVGSVALAGGRSIVGMIASTASVPLASIRGLPWFARSVRTSSIAASSWPVVRTALVSVALLLVFGALFASADALFARWVDLVVPDLSFDEFLVRLFVFGLVFAFALASVFVALVPPRVERLAVPAGRPVRRFEWAVPVGLVVATYAVFLVAQLAALFGGHDYLRRTTGLTYAEYVHQGFGQLTAATLLTLLVIAAAVRRAARDSEVDRIWLRVLLGLLCAFTLVVVGSALYRMHVYEEAYGFTRLRLLVSVFESWLGVLIVLVLVAGIRLRGRWVPLAGLLTGATMLLGLGLMNPDAFIADRNIERFEETGKIDVYYLSNLSDDAVPSMAGLPEPLRTCALQERPEANGDWLEWNLGRERAQRFLSGSSVRDRRSQCRSGSCTSC